ncbi:hypothetical protein HZC07_00170 [Candidatus Micrarchaeota archaeon]|nr:hypothetical protein [Candidatus Micrarchaeota archaeon]
MAKAQALRKRYILFQFNGSVVSSDELKRGIYDEALRFFGEYGLSFVALTLVE